MAIRRERGHSLHVVDFLVENSSSSGLDSATVDGNAALHYCAVYNQPECAKLLLRSGANAHLENRDAKTPLDLAKEFRSAECCELVRRFSFVFCFVLFWFGFSRICFPRPCIGLGLGSVQLCSSALL